MLKLSKKEDIVFWSKQYGINGSSILLEVPGFDVTKCILQDPMHVLLEGLLKFELQCLLRSSENNKSLIKKINERIRNFE